MCFHFSTVIISEKTENTKAFLHQVNHISSGREAVSFKRHVTASQSRWRCVLQVTAFIFFYLTTGVLARNRKENFENCYLYLRFS